jgi:hypothetical protein
MTVQVPVFPPVAGVAAKLVVVTPQRLWSAPALAGSEITMVTSLVEVPQPVPANVHLNI